MWDLVICHPKREACGWQVHFCKVPWISLFITIKYLTGYSSWWLFVICSFRGLTELPNKHSLQVWMDLIWKCWHSLVMIITFHCWLIVLGVSLWKQMMFLDFKCVFNEVVQLQIIKIPTFGQMLLFQFWVTSQFPWWLTQLYGQENRSNFVRPLVYYL